MNDAAFVDYLADKFPITIEFRAVDNDDLLEQIEVPGPGALEIRPQPRHCYVIMRFADGTTEQSGERGVE